jgi:hypothetical protein
MASRTLLSVRDKSPHDKRLFLNLNPNIMDVTIDFSLTKEDPVFHGKVRRLI